MFSSISWWAKSLSDRPVSCASADSRRSMSGFNTTEIKASPQLSHCHGSRRYASSARKGAAARRALAHLKASVRWVVLVCCCLLAMPGSLFDPLEGSNLAGVPRPDSAGGSREAGKQQEKNSQCLATCKTFRLCGRAADWRQGGRADGLGLFDVAGGGNFLASLDARR
jgi:hypothetical protein